MYVKAPTTRENIIERIGCRNISRNILSFVDSFQRRVQLCMSTTMNMCLNLLRWRNFIFY